MATLRGGTPARSTSLHQPDVQFRELLDSLPAAAYTCDATGLITYFNRRGVELWGREPLLNDPRDRYCGSFRLFLPDGTPIHHDRCWMALAIRDNRGYNASEIVIERPDGTRRTVLAHANPLGLFSEDIEPDDGRLLGNFPQAYTHVGMIHAATTIGALMDARDGHVRAWR